MPYLFATEKQNYADFASGQFFYSLPNQPAFPIRLMSEVFQRCMARLEANGRKPPYTLYDPCAGSGSHLAAVGYLHWPQISQIIASDIASEAVTILEKNLTLLTVGGVSKRIAELERYVKQFQKSSHQDNLRIAQTFQVALSQNLKHHAIKTKSAIGNIYTQNKEQIEEVAQMPIDILFADVPYGQKSAWQGMEHLEADKVPLWHFLDALMPVVQPATVIAIAADKGQKCRHEAYMQLERFQMGKRRLFLLAKNR